MIALASWFHFWSADRLLRDAEPPIGSLARRCGLETEAWLQDAIQAVEALARMEAVRRHDPPRPPNPLRPRLLRPARTP
jgi:hypothetical protein